MSENTYSYADDLARVEDKQSDSKKLTLNAMNVISDQGKLPTYGGGGEPDPEPTPIPTGDAKIFHITVPEMSGEGETPYIQIAGLAELPEMPGEFASALAFYPAAVEYLSTKVYAGDTFELAVPDVYDAALIFVVADSMAWEDTDGPQPLISGDIEYFGERTADLIVFAITGDCEITANPDAWEWDPSVPAFDPASVSVEYSGSSTVSGVRLNFVTYDSDPVTFNPYGYPNYRTITDQNDYSGSVVIGTTMEIETSGYHFTSVDPPEAGSILDSANNKQVLIYDSCTVYWSEDNQPQ